MPVGHVSAILAEKLSASIGVHPQLVTLSALLYALCALLIAIFLSAKICGYVLKELFVGENLRLSY